MNPQLSSLRTAESINLQVEQIIEAAFRQLQDGECVDANALAAAHPHFAEQLRDLLPTMEVLLRLGDVAGEPTEAWGQAGPSPQQGSRPHHEQQLGDFRIIRELGRGGMGTVFEAEQLTMGRRVALKVLPFAALAHEKSLQRFRNEVRAAAALDHPHIVSVYSVGEERGIHYFAMQLIRGRTVADLIEERRLSVVSSQSSVEKTGATVATDHGQRTTDTVPVAALSTIPAADSHHAAEFYRTAARLGIQAAEALQHAHDMGVLHRDIKPSNLMLDGEGQLYITDFGLARIEADAGMTMTGDLIGTLRYMAPEQALAKRVVIDHRADVYSLGATLYELLTLQAAFGETDRSELLKQIAFEEPRPLRKVDRRVPVDLDIVVLKAMEKNPVDRYQTAQVLADDLRAYLDDKPIKAKPPTPWQRANKWSRRHVGVVWSGVALLVIGITTLAWSNAQIRKESQAKETALAEKDAALIIARSTVDQLLVDVKGGPLDDNPATNSIRSKLLEKAIGFYEVLLKQAKDNIGLKKDLSEVLITTSNVQRSLGRIEEAILTGKKGVRIRHEFVAASPDDPNAWEGLASHEQSLANICSLSSQGPHAAEAEVHYRKAIEAYEKVERDWPDRPQPMGPCLRYLAMAAYQRSDEAEAERLWREAIARDEAYIEYALLNETSQIDQVQELDYQDQEVKLANAIVSLSWDCMELAGTMKNKTADAEVLLRKGLKHAANLVQTRPYWLDGREAHGKLIVALAGVVRDAGQMDEADRLLERLVQSTNDSAAREFPVIQLQALNLAASGYWAAGKLEKAETLATDALSLARENKLKHAALGRLSYIMADIELKRDHPEEAETWARKSIEGFQYPGQSHGSLSDASSLLARALHEQGRSAEASPVLVNPSSEATEQRE